MANNNSAKPSALTTAPTRLAIWIIRGTDFSCKTKEALKIKRRELNEAAGVYEVDTQKDGKTIEATPSNQWPYRITKGPDHPQFSPTGIWFWSNSTERLDKEDTVQFRGAIWRKSQ